MTQLYFGKIAPVEAQGEQVDGGGWSWRYKVRIIDKHPSDKTLLPDEELPWAQVLLPVTAGSGAANYAQSPMINAGDTVSIAYLDGNEEQPIITGILPRTNNVSTGEPNPDNGYVPHTGYHPERPINPAQPRDESNESNSASQPSERSDRYSSIIGDTVALTNTCSPDEYKTTAINSEMNNLFNQVNKFRNDAAYVETLIRGSVDRVHALVNPYVGDMFNNLFEALVPVLNAGLSALYKAVFAKVLAATGSTTAARLAAEAALIALQPPVQILQEAISQLAAQIVAQIIGKIDALVRDTVSNNGRYTSCTGEQFNAAIVNLIIDDIDAGMAPLLQALAIILSGGFSSAEALRSSVSMLRNFIGGFLGGNQAGNKCSGLIKEYAFGIGPKSNAGDILDGVLNAANIGKSLVTAAKSGDVLGTIGAATDLGSAVGGELGSVTNSAGEVIDAARSLGSVANNFEVPQLIEDFGDFPFLSETSRTPSELDLCNRGEEDVCYPPRVILFGGRGAGAEATAVIGEYVVSDEERGVSTVQGGVVAVEVTNRGSGYVYPPYVEFRDNCGSGIGAIGRAVLDKNGGVKAIYIINPGEGYIASGIDTFVVGGVEVLDGGDGYFPGIVTDEFGGRYEIVVSPPSDTIVERITPDTPNEQIIETVIGSLTPAPNGGPVTEIIPLDIVQVPSIPTILVPEINPPIPTGGRLTSDGVVVDINNNPIPPAGGLPGDKAIIGKSLKIKPRLIPLPPIEDILANNIPEELRDRVDRSELQEIIDCIKH